MPQRALLAASYLDRRQLVLRVPPPVPRSVESSYGLLYALRLYYWLYRFSCSSGVSAR